MEKQNRKLHEDHIHKSEIMDNPELYMDLEDDLFAGVIDQERFDFIWKHRNEF